MAPRWDLALRLARACEAIYVDDPKKIHEQTIDGWKVAASEGKGRGATSLAAVLDGDDAIVVTYRGTLVPEAAKLGDWVLDWIRNFEAILVPFQNSASKLGVAAPHYLSGNVHFGFLRELEFVQEWVLAQVRARLAKKSREVYVTGHSQGAALAILSTAALSEAQVPVTATYTFAAPRAGDAGMRAGIRTPVYRFEHGRDIVPHVPPSKLKRALQGLRVPNWAIEALNSGGPAFTRPLIASLPAGAHSIASAIEKSQEPFKSLIAHWGMSNFVAVGPLWYGEHLAKDKNDLIPCDEEKENALILDRILDMLAHPGDMGDDHWIGHYVRMLS